MYDIHDAVLSVICTHKGLAMPDAAKAVKERALPAIAISRALNVGIRQTNYSLLKLTMQGLIERRADLGAQTRVRYLYSPVWAQVVWHFTGLNTDQMSHEEFESYARDIQYHLAQGFDYKPLRKSNWSGKR